MSVSKKALGKRKVRWADEEEADPSSTPPSKRQRPSEATNVTALEEPESNFVGDEWVEPELAGPDEFLKPEQMRPFQNADTAQALQEPLSARKGLIPKSSAAETNFDDYYEGSARDMLIAGALMGRGAGTLAPKHTPRQEHPRLRKALMRHPAINPSAGEVEFFTNQDPKRKIMTTGIPLEETPADLIPFIREQRKKFNNHPNRGGARMKFTRRKPDGTYLILDQGLHDTSGPSTIKAGGGVMQGVGDRLSRFDVLHCDLDNTNREPNYLQEESFHQRPAVHINIPDNLKGLLVDDWEEVTKSMRLVPLPAEHSVNEILDTYFDEEKSKRRFGSADADLLEEVVAGLKEYFEKTLGKLLLYRFERQQYLDARQQWEAGIGDYEGKTAGDVYGAEHLARLFGK